MKILPVKMSAELETSCCSQNFYTTEPVDCWSCHIRVLGTVVGSAGPYDGIRYKTEKAAINAAKRDLKQRQDL